MLSWAKLIQMQAIKPGFIRSNRSFPTGGLPYMLCFVVTFISLEYTALPSFKAKDCVVQVFSELGDYYLKRKNTLK